MAPPADEFFRGWETYQRKIIDSLRGLTPEQLELRASPRHRPLWRLPAHMIGARARWVHDVLGEGGDAMKAFRRWDARSARPRRAAELVDGLATTFHLLMEARSKWSAADYAFLVHEEADGVIYEYPRAWVIWHLLEHDLHHGGEISITLGIHKHKAPDI